MVYIAVKIRYMRRYNKNSLANTIFFPPALVSFLQACFTIQISKTKVESCIDVFFTLVLLFYCPLAVDFHDEGSTTDILSYAPP